MAAGRAGGRPARHGDALQRLGRAGWRGAATPSLGRAVPPSRQGRPLRAARARKGRRTGRRARTHDRPGAPTAARRLCADRSGHRPARRARPGQLLHLVPQPGQGLVLEGHEGQARPGRLGGVQAHRVRGQARRLPARGADLRVPPRQDPRPLGRGAGDDHHRQPDGRRHRSPHLQRLRQSLHLSEADAGRHPAGGDPDAQGRARTALGLRDLRPADALEPSEPAAPHAAAGFGIQSAGRGDGTGGLHARPPPDQRRSRGRRHRRAEDRTAAATPVGGG